MTPPDVAPSEEWVRRAEAFRKKLDREGRSVSEFAREHGLSYMACIHALRRTSPCKRGEAHKAAVLMGLKDGVVLERTKALPSPSLRRTRKAATPA